MKQENVKYIPLIMFAAAFVKGLVFSPSWAEVTFVSVMGLCAFAYQFFVDETRLKLMHKRLDQVDVHLTELYKANDEIKGHMSAVKVTQNLRSTTLFGQK